MTRLLLTSTRSLQIPTSIFYPQVAILLIAARTYHTAWHYASDASALTTRPFEKRVSDLSVHLNKRGYQKQVIDQAIEKVRHIDRQNLLSYKPKPTANKAVPPFVMTYHPELPKVRGIVDKHWSIIESSDHLSTVFQQKPIMAFRRPKSLRDHLVQARLKQIQSMMSLLENANPAADQDVRPNE